MHKEIIFPQHCTPWSHNPLAPIHVPKNPAMYHNEPPVPLHAPKRHPCSPCMYQNDIPAPICMYQNDTPAPLCMYQNDTPIKSCTKTNPLCRNVPKRCVPTSRSKSQGTSRGPGPYSAPSPAETKGTRETGQISYILTRMSIRTSVLIIVVPNYAFLHRLAQKVAQG